MLQEIQDKYVRENFFRLTRFIQDQVILDGNWKLLEHYFPKAVTNFKKEHTLGFKPKDIIILNVTGDRNVYFHYDKFTKTHLDITAAGPCKIRFLAGSFKEDFLGSVGADLPHVAIGGSTVTPTPINQMVHTMNCAASVAIDDWVYQSTTVDNTAVTASDNTQSTPIIGIVKAKPTTTTCEVIQVGYHTFSIARGRMFHSVSGGASLVGPSTGYIQTLGMSFGNGTIFINPEYRRIRRT